jgi:anaerobic ribonucleoside-triphosphate reductase activating protein
LPAISIYFAGCDAQPKCFNCHNKELWDEKSGVEVQLYEALEKITSKVDELLTTYRKVSVVFLGGEPLAPYNRSWMWKISVELKRRYSNRIVLLLYSWRMPKDIYEEKLMSFVEHIDEFVLGRYIEHLKNLDVEGNILFPASLNQIYITKEELFEIFKEIEDEERS